MYNSNRLHAHATVLFYRIFTAYNYVCVIILIIIISNGAALAREESAHEKKMMVGIAHAFNEIERNCGCENIVVRPCHAHHACLHVLPEKYKIRCLFKVLPSLIDRLNAKWSSVWSTNVNGRSLLQSCVLSHLVLLKFIKCTCIGDSHSYSCWYFMKPHLKRKSSAITFM